MTKEYIEVKIPILNDVEEMEVVKSFTEEQLWYVCAIAKAFENKEIENTNLERQIQKYKEVNSRITKILDFFISSENLSKYHTLKILMRIKKILKEVE